MAFEAERVREIAERVAASSGLEVVEVELRGGGKARMLRIVIDKPAGVTHEDCANLSREVGTILDVEDAVPGGSYTLEVSSPGLDRKLVRPADYERFTGSRVKLTTRNPVNGNRLFEGKLESFQQGRLTLDVSTARNKFRRSNGEQRLEIDLANVEKANDPQIVVSAVEDAIVVATRKYYKTQENLRAELDKETGKINAFAVKSIVESPEQVEDPQLQVTVDDARKVDPGAEIGGELKIPKVTEGILGRIAAQLAKQVIFQKVREAERDTVYNEYIGRVGEIVNATVKRIEGPDVILDIGKAEARMPRKEQSRLESFAMGERVRVVIARVEKASKGPAVVVSRAAPELVQHLFQTEVPEIYDGTVVMWAIAREAGVLPQIVVMSKDEDEAAFVACVGMKGMRVQS